MASTQAGSACRFWTTVAWVHFTVKNLRSSHRAAQVPFFCENPMTPPFSRSSLLTFAVVGTLTALALTSCGRRRTVVVYDTQPSPPPVYVEYRPAPLAPTTVVVQEPPPTIVVQEPAPTVVYQDVAWEDEEVNYVVYREYYGCSAEEVVVIPHYRHYYRVDDADLFFVCFVARHAHVSFDVAFHEYYYTCGRDYHRLVLSYRIDPVVFFVPLPPQTFYPVVYSRPYACYRSHQYTGVAFSNDEYRALVSLKIGVEYQGQSSEVFFRNAQTHGSPTRVLYVERERCGQGGHVWSGARPKPVVHPWQLSVSERTTWRAQVGTQHANSQVEFKQQHHEQVTLVEHGGAEPRFPIEHRPAPAAHADEPVTRTPVRPTPTPTPTPAPNAARPVPAQPHNHGPSVSSSPANGGGVQPHADEPHRNDGGADAQVRPQPRPTVYREPATDPQPRPTVHHESPADPHVAAPTPPQPRPTIHRDPGTDPHSAAPAPPHQANGVQPGGRPDLGNDAGNRPSAPQHADDGRDRDDHGRGKGDGGGR